MSGYDVYQAGQDLSFAVDLVDQFSGQSITAVSGTVTILDEDGVVVAAASPLTIIAGDPAVGTFTVDSLVNTVLESESRQALLEITDDVGNVRRIDYYYVLENGDKVVTGENSYAFMGYIVRQSTSMSGIDAFNDAGHADKQKALISAYYNMARLPLSIDGEHPNDMTEDDLVNIDQSYVLKLVRAQIREANFLLGDDEIDDARRRGLISQSHGEITEFFRVSKPVETPACRAALNELTGLLSWNLKIGRA